MNASHHVSRSFTEAEKDYSQNKKEGLALIFPIQTCYRIVLAPKFTINTDHTPLLARFGPKRSSLYVQRIDSKMGANSP